MKYIVAIGLILCFLTSCTFYEPEIRGGETFKMKKFGGKEVQFTAGAKVYNGNWFPVKIKKSTLDLYVDNQYMGKVHLLNKVKMKAKKETDLVGDFLLELEGNAVMKALGLAMKGKLVVRMKGKIKGGVFIFSKKLDFDESRTVNGSSFK